MDESFASGAVSSDTGAGDWTSNDSFFDVDLRLGIHAGSDELACIASLFSVGLACITYIF